MSRFLIYNEETSTETVTKKKEKVQSEWSIILYNDDVNTFDHVIESLMEICGHDYIQAGQCSVIVHTKGKCGVKNGDYPKLKPMCEGLLDRGLSAKIE